jgi:outer membrane autotransporter protein
MLKSQANEILLDGSGAFCTMLDLVKCQSPLTALPMKTKQFKIPTRLAKKRLGIITSSIIAFLGFGAPVRGQAVDQFWTGSTDFTPTTAMSGFWTTDVRVLNWSDTSTSPGNFPWTNGNTAHFLDPTGVTVTLTSDITAAGINFHSGAGPFLIQTNGSTLTLQGVGIVNNSASAQTIRNDFGGSTNFLNNSSAGNAAIINTNSGSGAGTTNFQNASTAASATITNNNGGTTNFKDNSTAGNASITINGDGTVTGSGFTNFNGTSSAGKATIDNNAPSIPGSTTGTVVYTLVFNDSATAGNSTIMTSGSASHTNFLGTSSAGSAAITDSGPGSQTNFGGSSSAATSTITHSGQGSASGFFTTATAGNATIVNSGMNSFTVFQDASTAENAIISNVGTSSTTQFKGSATAATSMITNTGQNSFNFFSNASTADNATITNGGAGSSTSFMDTSTAANATFTNSGTSAATQFRNSSTAGSSVITNSGDNSFTLFQDSSSGENVRLINANPTAYIDISRLTVSGTTAGSIEGNGSFFLGSKNLAVGSNNLSTAFSGVISDGGPPSSENTDTGGSLTKVGSGTLTLTGANTYTGPTIVDGGSLIVDGSIGTGLTTINAAGLLGGRGTIGGSVVNSGIVSPGNPLGTLTINGNYTQNGGGTLRIEIAGAGAGQHDLLIVGGSANLGGTLQLVRLNNFQLQPGEQITFLNASGGVTGTFSTVQNNVLATGTVLSSKILYNTNSVVLQVQQGSFAKFVQTFCKMPGEVPVGAALDRLATSEKSSPLIQFLDSQTPEQLCRDIDKISPQEVAAVYNVSVSLAVVQAINLDRRMDDIRRGSTGFSANGFSINNETPGIVMGWGDQSASDGKSGPSSDGKDYVEEKTSPMAPVPQNRWGVFVTGIGEFTDVDNTALAPGYDLSTGGVTIGADYRVCPNFAIGLTAGYAHTNADLTDNGRLDVDGGKIGAYATAFTGGAYVEGAVVGGFNDFDSRRTALGGDARGDTNGYDVSGLIAGGYDFKVGALTVGPFANYQYTHVEIDGFAEQGSMAPLVFQDQDADSHRTALGAKASYDWKIGGVVLKPELRGAWQHEFGDRDFSLVSRFAAGTTPFTVTGPAIGRDSFLLGAGAAVLVGDRLSVYTYYDGELARNNYSSHNVSAGFRVTF